MMDRKATAKETLRILEQGYYGFGGSRVDIQKLHEKSVKDSVLISPQEGNEMLESFGKESHRKEEEGKPHCGANRWFVRDISSVDAARMLALEGKDRIAILNFASAKNPGGGFLNGAMAQEESLAASGGLYETLTAHPEYYRINRACPSMMYTDYAIYSPEVVFFRDGGFRLLEEPFTASVLTMPAVNMGQVVLKGEDPDMAENVMRHRMALVLAILAEKGCRHLVLGAYGCGVFRNDPEKIAAWWKELLTERFNGCFDTVVFAVMDRSRNQQCLKPFLELVSPASSTAAE